MFEITVYSQIPNLVIAVLLAIIMWKTGLRGAWLLACLGPLVSDFISRWFLYSSIPDFWTSIALRVILPFAVKWAALFAMVFKNWPNAKTDMKPSEPSL